ncbi:hypothetical protein [Nakamurella endophytica]|uniref:Fatty acid kinase subunit A-like middle domain-containing protein n=1 Tax=Nakamurella endophytica TaxID=1748367 RepID=A0A917T253_9ACTN|nr:hypothetical protein [Nakamurella endophytica]GGM06576.1 hypothetical protein GCM10011594_28310 [Nakamurella endophytica]
MPALDADLVHRWFDGLRAPAPEPERSWGAGWSAADVAVLADEEPVLTASVSGVLPAATEPATDPVARGVQRYLHGVAAGIAGSRAAWGQADGPSADAMCLAAGLMAGAAALSGPDLPVPAPGGPVAGGDGPPVPDPAGSWRPPDGWPATGRGGVPTERSAADTAASAGLAATDRAVEGYGLADVAGRAADAAVMGWQVSVPSDSADRAAYRLRALVCAVLMALQRACVPPPPPAEPASCGARPGEPVGDPFPAEVSFDVFLGDAELADLRRRLAALSSEVVVWSDADIRHLHVHTERPGPVVSEAFAAGTVFALHIAAARPGAAHPGAPGG